MTDTKHTPGPWRAMRNSAFWEIIPINAGGDGIPFTVANVCSSAPQNPDGGLQEANARLIAAAPDMLATIEALRAENARLLKKNAVLEEAWRNSRHERSKQFPIIGSATMGDE